jgi:hypothetical protein
MNVSIKTMSMILKFMMYTRTFKMIIFKFKKIRST